MRKKDHLIHQLKDEWKEMHFFLSKKTKGGATREKLHEELKWLKKQLDYYEKSSDQENLLNYFNEVVDHLNDQLHLPKSQMFKKQKRK